MTRFAARIQLEDVALVAVMVLGPLLAGSGSLADTLLDRQHDPLLGLFALTAAVGAMVAMATRVPGESRFDESEGRYWIIGPFVGAVGLTAGSALELIGVDGGDIVTGPAFIVAVLSVVLADRLPIVERRIRRLLVAPFVLLTGAVFQGLAADLTAALTGLVDLPAIVSHPDAIQLLLLVVVVSLAVSWIFYAMLVFAPRELADPGAPTRWWILRFGLFWVSLILGMALGGGAPVAL